MSESTSPNRGLGSMNGWWAASGLLILLVIIGVVAVLIWGPSDSAPAAPPSASAPTSAPAGQDPAPQDKDQKVLTAAPSSDWDLLYGLALPTAAGVGPSAKDGTLWSGWAHTATGALMAAAYLVAATDSPDALTVMKQHAIDGPAARAYINQLSITPKTIDPTTTPALGGFRFRSYTPESARVEFVYVANNFAASLPVNLTWEGGDWKIDFEVGGEPTVTRLAGTAGFIPWSAAA